MLEYLRVVLVLIFGTTALMAVEELIYRQFNNSLFNNPMNWMVAIANFLIIFVVYRNKLQFSGWGRSSNGVKLSKVTTRILVALSIVLLVFPLVNL